MNNPKKGVYKMKLDTAIKTFYEKYDREAIQSIETISNDYGLNIHGHTIQTFNLNEAFDRFSNYLKGYADYKIDREMALQFAEYVHVSVAL